MIHFQPHRKSLEHHRLVANVKQHAWYYALAGLVIILLFLFRKPLIKIFFLLAMLTLGSFSTFYKRFGDIPLGFELMTFFGVVIALTYSLFLGILSVILMTFFFLSHYFACLCDDVPAHGGFCHCRTYRIHLSRLWHCNHGADCFDHYEYDFPLPLACCHAF